MVVRMKRILMLIVLTFWAISNSGFKDNHVFSTAVVLGAEKSTGPTLKAGQKNWIGDQYYFVYDFDKKPQMGTIIMKIQVFSKEGKQDSSFEITGSADMPSMRGAHSTGHQPFRLNHKGDYLLPVNVVMPGEWELVLNIVKDKKPVYSGSVRFNV
jgi:hypothetical protein